MTALNVAAPVPPDEEERLADLHAYEILDTDPEERFDDIAHLAAAICGARWAALNFVDVRRQWTKTGPDGGRDTSRDVAFCAHTIVAPDGFMVVEDTHTDARFARNVHVVGEPNIRFYAGAAIRASSGRAVGTVCVVDREPRMLDDDQKDALRALGRVASDALELRHLLARERRLVRGMRDLDRQKAEFTVTVSHDLRAPLTAIRGYAELLREHAVAEETALDAIERGADRLLRLVDDLTGSATELHVETIDLADLARAAAELARPAAQALDVRIDVDARPAPLVGDPHHLSQLLDNLVGNGVKYAPGGVVRVQTRPGDGTAVVEISDTGVGVPADEIPRLFDRFYRASTSTGFAGTGIGLATVKAVVDAHGGTIDVRSRVACGTSVRVELPAP